MTNVLRFFCMLVLVVASTPALQAEEPVSQFRIAQQLYDEGNFQEALDAFGQVLAREDSKSSELATSVARTLDCLQRLNRLNEADNFLELTAENYQDNWRVLTALGQGIMQLPQYGYQIAGEFWRGPHRGGGKVVTSADRDRVWAMQQFRRAVELVEQQPDAQKTRAALTLLQQFANALMHGSDTNQAWRLQELTDLTELPDYEEGLEHGWGTFGGARGRGAMIAPISNTGAPIDEDGNIVVYDLPNSWDDAANDGQRWRWVLEQITRWQPEKVNVARLSRARFLESQFGAETLAEYGWWFGQQDSRDPSKDESGTYALHTLGEDETIARLATGIKRFDLPDEHNFIMLYQQVAESAGATDALTEWNTATTALASLFENRRQYPRAAEYWKQLAEKGANKTWAQERLDQIVGNWGRFGNVMSQPAGRGPQIDFRYRNGKQVEFTAKRIKVRELLDDVKAYLKSEPQQLDWQKLQIENIGHRLVTENQEKYLGDEVARWSQELAPLERHFDRRINVTTPLQEPGAYLLTSKMEDGNSNSIVIWINDTAIVKKPLDGKAMYYVADAVSGKPVAKANVELFGYWQEHLDGNRFRVRTKNVAELTNDEGIVQVAADESNRRHQWLAVATTPEGRFAYLGFRSIWSGEYHDHQYRQVKVFTVTDRPVYRPDQTMHFKFWVRYAQYDKEDDSSFASNSFKIEIHDPKGEKVHTAQLTADTYGGISGKWQVPEGATLGQYRIQVVNYGGGHFRVEEYKKPEFEVKVETPKEPASLGDTITAKISANYYFGAPVTEATVRYRVLRTTHSQIWLPPMPWDWLYGRGYGWLGENYSWYPDWNRWGCFPPPPWWPWQQPAPELVSERVVEINPDGTVEVEIDTSVAKEFHPNQDHRYQIEVEVTDQSRRTITGSGEVLVAREPFRVIVWTNRGHYRVEDTIEVSTAANTIAGEPVSGTGVLRLLKVDYVDAKPVETEVGQWKLELGETGRGDLSIKASAAGQYRLSYELTSEKGDKIEGGHLFTITGPGFDGSEFRFNDIEVIPDRREYKPGDKVSLQINTNQAGSAVLLFLRPANGIYQPPRLVQLTGKSTLVDVEVTAKDMPNFFIEAVTVHHGRVHSAIREIFVPPAKRVLDVELVPSAETFLPGEQAKLKVKITDKEGKPFVGSLAIAVYDKALDYIAGDAQVADIREFFWKWRRMHRPNSENNLEWVSMPVVKPNKPTMQNLGIFGERVVDEIPADGAQVFFSGQDRFQQPVFGGRQRAGAIQTMAVPESAAMSDSLDKGLAPARAGGFGDEAAPAETVEPVIRQEFADTAFWKAAIQTDSEGVAEVEFDMPENLTTWKAQTWAMGHGTRVGQASVDLITRKNIIVRMQAPRFFVESDEVVLTANVHNYLSQEKEVRVRLELDGDTLEGPEKLQQVVTIPAEGEQRVDWRVKAVKEGDAIIRMSALTDEESDAMQMTFPVLVHGMLKTESYTGVLRPDDSSSQFEITIPAQRRPEQTRLEVRYTPTLAGTMVDALPYLIEYPYGCTEQTLNRFLPAVLTRQTLNRMGIDLDAVRDQRAARQPEEEEGDQNEKVAKPFRFRLEPRNPVFDTKELDAVVKAGVNRLTEMQLADGGWGWFSGCGERSSPHTTAVVLRGLIIAHQNEVAIVPGVIERGVAWLENYQAEQIKLINNHEQQEKDEQTARHKPSKPHADNLDALVLLVLSEHKKANRADITEEMQEMRDFLYRDRAQLAVYSLATYGLALHYQGEEVKLAMVMRNLNQYLREDDENQTAWLEMPGGFWWFWYGSEFEAHAFYLKLLAATDPESEIAPRLVKYLVNNRRHATYWNSTRDTALVVEAFSDFLEATGEDAPDVTIEIWIDGQQRQQVHVNRENLFTFENQLVVLGDELSSGRHTVEVRKDGNSPVYYNGFLTNFTLEDDITAAGLEIKVDRRYFKLTPADKATTVPGSRGQVVGQQVEKYDRTPIVNHEELQSGDLVEIELVVESKNDYEYIILEDMKAAGMEPVAVRSGYDGNELGAYVELRDQRVTLFVTKLARGKHSVTYQMRAEIPGRFSALPARAEAMYAPDLRANSDEMKLGIVDE